MRSYRYGNLPREGHDVLHRADDPLADGHIWVSFCFQEALKVLWGTEGATGVCSGNGRPRSSNLSQAYTTSTIVGVSNFPIALAIVAVILNWVLQDITELLRLLRSIH